MSSLVLLRGGGDLGTGVAYRLHKAGLRLAIAELPRPMHVRRSVAFAEAVYEGAASVESICARIVDGLPGIEATIARGEIPVVVDPDLALLPELQPVALVDARMTKRPPEIGLDVASLVVGLGPGFVAGQTCHAVVETMRGHDLGRVIWEGPPLPNTGRPGSIARFDLDRVLRAPADGRVKPEFAIGDRVKAGDLIATVAGTEVRAQFDGVLRGLVHPDLDVTKGMKIGDVDPRNDPAYAQRISDKSLAIGGGVLEALLAKPAIRQQLYS